MVVNSGRLNVVLGNWHLKNPVMTASGTFGYGSEFESFVDLNKLGALVVKGISLQPRKGNPPPRVFETSCGMLNAIGLENVGLDYFIKEKIPYLKEYNTQVVVNILGDSIEEYEELTEKLSEVDGIGAIEVNISCPNVKKGGVAFGTDARMAHAVTSAVMKRSAVPVIIKLSPNVSNIVEIASAVEEGGADAISLINTLIGMAINIHTRKPVLANVIGGLSGPAIKPIALRMVWQVAQAVSIPVIGIGGITTAQDVIEFILAGASAIQVGTANFINPSVTGDILKELDSYLERNDTTVEKLIGGLEV